MARTTRQMVSSALFEAFFVVLGVVLALAALISTFLYRESELLGHYDEVLAALDGGS